jgi:hypothetical protein
MGDLIFVPELGLISGKSQNFKLSSIYPQPYLMKLAIKSTTRSPKKNKSKLSPFTTTQRVFSVKNRAESPKRKEKAIRNLTLDINIYQKPMTTNSNRPRPSKEVTKNLDSYRLNNKDLLSPNLEVNLQKRPISIGRISKKKQIEPLSPIEDFDGTVNLPSLQQRPKPT